MGEKIRAENVTKIFSGNGMAVEALKDLSLKVREEEFFGIVGPTGCGKTTLLNLIAGLEEPTNGAIFIDGSKISGPGFDRGMLFQEGALLPWRTVIKNVEFGLEIRGIEEKEREKTAKKYIQMVGLSGFEESYPYQLSGGMTQRVALARVLTFDPQILLMDEPFASVDALTREKLRTDLVKIWEKTKKTVVFVTHSIEEAVYLSDRIAVLTARPARVKEIVEIEIPRPRVETKNSQKFSELKEKIWGMLKGEVG